MLKQIRYFFLLFAFSAAFSAQAQDTLLVAAQIFNNGTVVRWQPFNPDTWAKLLRVGYRVERQELPSGAKTVLADKLMPKDTNWFKGHSTDADGMMEVIGALLYDTTFQYKEKSLMNANAVRYNYILYEAQYNAPIGIAIGTAIVDTLRSTEKSYRYTVVSLDGTARGWVELPAQSSGTIENPLNRSIEYTFPNDMSLSDMSPAKRAYVFPQLFSIARAYGDSVVLRWGPNTVKLWKEANQNGYTIERGTDFGNMVKIADVKPWSREQITPAIENDSFAMLAASNLYPMDDGGAASIYDKASLEENRFGFSLYAAERSTLAAEILGIRFVDKNVQRGVTYKYAVKTKTVPGFLSEGWLDVENNYVPPPPPAGLSLTAGDGQILLSWAKEANESRFSSYLLERSEDSKNWQSVTSTPLIFIETPEYPLGSFGYKDSIGVNYKTFYYRLRGYDSFGDLSAPAPVQGQAIDMTPPEPPLITGGEFFPKEKKIVIRWEAPALLPDFAGFQVLLGKNATGYFDTLTTKLLKAGAREYTYTSDSINGDRAHYFRVAAKDKAGNTAWSGEKYVHVPDLVAPEPPTTFSGVIGDDGKVNLIWEHSVSTDVAGYWIYFANDPNDEFSPLNTQALSENYFSYKIDEYSLNKAIYYMVAAEDKNTNRGKPSRVLELKRPDKVAPITPIQFQPVGNSTGVNLSWKRSASDDVMTYQIYRRTYGSDEEWQLMRTVKSDADSIFADTSAAMDVLYEYKMLAEDGSGNKSEYTVASSAKRVIDPAQIQVNNFTAQLAGDKRSATLFWTFNPSKSALPAGLNYQFVVLKSQGAGNVEYLTTLPAGSTSFADSQPPQPGVLYNYAVQIKLNNGQSGQMSPVKSVMINQ